MAFAFRKIISNINYFKKPEEQETQEFEERVAQRRHTLVPDDDILMIEEPDSTSRHCLALPESVKNFAAKKGSLSDTDLLLNDSPTRRKSKKLKLDIEKASRSMTDPIQSSDNIENTPKHVLLQCHSSDAFCERLKEFDFSKSFEINDSESDGNVSSFEEDNFDIQSLSDQSDSEVSVHGSKSQIKMCRKVEPNETQSSNEDGITAPSATPESFGEVEIDKNEEERKKLLNEYQLKFDKIQTVLKKLLNDFEFHIEFAKVFNSRSIITAPPDTDVTNIPKSLGEVTYLDNVSRGPSPAGSWNIITEKEDNETKVKVKKQLQAIKNTIDFFVQEHLQNYPEENQKDSIVGQCRNITFDMHRHKRSSQKRVKITSRKKIKYYDFPDLREALINLFSLEPDRDDTSISANNVTILLSDSDSETKCNCTCHCQHSTSQTDSGLINKTGASLSSITSSIGNFSLDSSTLSAYSESLDQIISYNSFQDTSLFSSVLQKAAIERITFYVQVHSIQLKCEISQDNDFKSNLTFHCPSCESMETEENGLLKHILSQRHCEKIHFLYKTAYIKKCVSAGKEIQPSTVLNSMTMYRDENKIVCFGDALYACSLCFENLIVGESVLMAHCADPQHVERREKLYEMIE